MVYKLNAEGDIDTLFGDNGRVRLDIGNSNSKTNRNYASTISSDGGLHITGSGAGTDDSYVVKLLVDGDLDSTFGASGIAKVRGLDTAYAIAVDDQEQIYVGGGISSGGWRAAFSKLNRDGTPDYSFGENGYQRASIGSSVLDIDIDYKGRVLASISNYGLSYATMRLSDDGQIDRSFNELGVIAIGEEALYINDEVSILIDEGLYRYKENGSLDTSFGNNGVAAGGGTSITTFDNGNIVTQSRNSLYFYTSEGITLAAAPVRSSTSYTLKSGEENLILTGNNAINGTGNNLKNIIIGNNANNKINGKQGADKMRARKGNDIYYVNNKNDKVIELANQGTDTVRSSVNETLNTNVENLVLISGKAINGKGNTLNNKITGNNNENNLKSENGEDKIYGRGAKDILTGGAKADQFIYKSITDSGITNATREIITDFSEIDKINLSKIDANELKNGNQEFEFIGSKPFTKIVQVIFGKVNGFLSMNTDNDSKADMQINLLDVTSFNENFLIL